MHLAVLAALGGAGAWVQPASRPRLSQPRATMMSELAPQYEIFDAHRLRLVVARLGVVPSERELVSLMSRIDSDNDGIISFSEFVDFVTHRGAADETSSLVGMLREELRDKTRYERAKAAATRKINGHPIHHDLLLNTTSTTTTTPTTPTTTREETTTRNNFAPRTEDDDDDFFPSGSDRHGQHLEDATRLDLLSSSSSPSHHTRRHQVNGHDVVVVDHSEEGGLQQKMEQQQHQRAPPFELYEPPQRRQVVDAKNQRDDDDDPRSRRPSEDDDDDQGSGPNLVVEEARPSLDSRALRSEFAEMSRVKHEARVVVGGVKPQYTSSSRTGYDARDWGRVLLTWPSSFVVRRIRSPLIAISLWSLVVACVHQVLVTSPAVGAFFLGSLGAAAPGVGISRTMTLAGSALSLLLVFRTNTAYNRYAEGRKVWERICAATRDCAEFCAVYVPEIGEARVKRIADLLVAFPLTLILYLQGQRIPYEPQDALEGAFHSVVKEGKIRRFQRRKRLPKILEETKSLLGRLFRQQRRRKATTRTMNAYIHQQRWLGLHAAPGRKREGHDGHDGHDDHSSYFAAAAAAGGGSTSSSLSSSSQFSSQQSPHHHTSRKEKKQRRQRRHSDFFSWTDDQHAEDIPKSLVDNAAQAQSRWRMDRDRGPKVPLDTFVAQCRRDDSLAACFSLPSDVEPEVALAQLHQLKFGRKRKPDAPVTLSELAAYYNPLALARLLTPADRARLARSRCPPLDVARQLTKEAKAVPFDEEKFTSRERMALITLVGKLRHAVGSAERIAQTPVPLHYARHALRFLSLWSLALPLALVNQLGFLTVPATAFIVWALFGLREIGTLIENPFSRPLQLQIVSDTLMIDVREAVDSINYYDSNHLHR